MRKPRWSGSGYKKATTGDELPTYECVRHGAVKPRVQLRKSGYIHRRCPDCYRDAHNRAQGKWNKRERARCRDLVLKHYGGACVCCRESNFGFLTIDHEFDNGKAHRADGVALSIYYWLLKNDYPSTGFRILCFNCNLGRARNGGICPHQAQVT